MLFRSSYLLANRCAVLSERGADLAEEEALASGIAFADYDQLVSRACQLVHSAPELRRLAEQGFALMRARPIAPLLEAALHD